MQGAVAIGTVQEENTKQHGEIKTAKNNCDFNLYHHFRTTLLAVARFYNSEAVGIIYVLVVMQSTQIPSYL